MILIFSITKLDKGSVSCIGNGMIQNIGQQLDINALTNLLFLWCMFFLLPTKNPRTVCM